MCCEREEINMKSPTTKVGKTKTTLQQSPRPRDDSPIRAIACLNRIDDMRRFEETEDCFILGFDPSSTSVPLSCDSSAPHHHAEDDLSVIAEKGQVACRDYPHSRHLCLKFPFKTTPHESYCEMCYCYVCDSAAPCKDWTGWHCNAESGGFWKNERNMKKQPPRPLSNSQP
ncbi:31 kDa ribonucleoprotein [Spatholobus suberectus]|nr:31 kDa ribonucleoprotein [Spatholobus suberectus]